MPGHFFKVVGGVGPCEVSRSVQIRLAVGQIAFGFRTCEAHLPTVEGAHPILAAISRRFRPTPRKWRRSQSASFSL